MMKTIRIILAEDQIMVRESFRIALEKSPHLKIVGEVEDGKDLIKLWKKLKPDLLVVDNQLIQMDGIEAIKTIRKSDG
ncbi:partial Transcriptional regulatory protein LiaR, partial [Anaerolineae bacterium]